MDTISQLIKDVKSLKRQVSEMIRMATVTAIDIETTRLTCESEGLEQTNIPFFTARAGEDQTYWLPSIGELGFLFSPSGISANAVFLPGIFFSGFPAADTNPAVAKRIFRDGQTETIDTETTQYTYQIGEDGTPTRIINTEKIEDSFGTPKRIIEEDKIEDSFGTPKRVIQEDKIEDIFSTLKRSINASKIEDKAGANVLELSSILLNLLGAHFYASGTTTLLTSMGPVLFTPAPSPTAPPAPPAGSAPDSEGNATQVPEQTVENIKITDGDISFTIPSLTVNVTGTAGPYPIVATAATVLKSITPDITASDITLVIPPAPLS